MYNATCKSCGKPCGLVVPDTQSMGWVSECCGSGYIKHESVTVEQQPPQPSTGDVWLLVLADMEERRRHGIEKYGTPVQPHNGRDPLVDGYQEALDLCVYLRQAIEEIRCMKADVERMKVVLTRMRKTVENGEEYSKLDAGSLHLMIIEALEER